MTNAFHHGGWGMYPTTLIGLVLLFSAARYAMSPDTRSMAVVRCLSILTILSGTLGFVTGAIRSFTSLGALDAKDGPVAALIGVGESLNNIGLSLFVLVLAWIAVTIGAARRTPTGTRTIAELTDPLV